MFSLLLLLKAVFPAPSTKVVFPAPPTHRELWVLVNGGGIVRVDECGVQQVPAGPAGLPLGPVRLHDVLQLDPGAAKYRLRATLPNTRGSVEKYPDGNPNVARSKGAVLKVLKPRVCPRGRLPGQDV